MESHRFDMYNRERPARGGPPATGDQVGTEHDPKDRAARFRRRAGSGKLDSKSSVYIFKRNALLQP